MLNNKLKPIAIAIGAAFAGSLASVALADAEADLFAADELEPSYDLVADKHEGDGSCGDKESSDGACGDGTCGDKESSEGAGDDDPEEAAEGAATGDDA